MRERIRKNGVSERKERVKRETGRFRDRENQREWNEREDI